MDSNILKLIRYIKKIMPLRSDLSESYKKAVEELPTKTVSLFVSSENLAKELAVYYMMTHNLLSHTEYILAEELVDIKFNRGTGNKSCYDYYADVFIIDISSLTKNNMAFSIINSFVKYALNIPTNKCVVIFFKGNRKSYRSYKASQQNDLEVDQCVFFDEKDEVDIEQNVDFDFVDNSVISQRDEPVKNPKTEVSAVDEIKAKQPEAQQIQKEKKANHEGNSIPDKKVDCNLNSRSRKKGVSKNDNVVELNRNNKHKNSVKGKFEKEGVKIESSNVDKKNIDSSQYIVKDVPNNSSKEKGMINSFDF